MGYGYSNGSGGGSGGARPKGVTVPAATTGVITTLSRKLASTSVFSLLSGSNANLAINSSTGAVSAMAGITAGQSQVAYVREAISASHQAIEYVVTLTAATPAPSAPAAPSLTATAGDGEITLSWTDGSNGGASITSHKLYRGTVSGSLSLLGTITDASPFVDDTVSNGTTYYYKLSAVNSIGESALSAERSATPSATAFLPALTTPSASYHRVWSNERLMEGFSGALVNAGGSDLGASGTGVTSAEVATARGASDVIRAASWYDQSGNAVALSQSTAAARPAMHEDVTLNGTPCMAFDGHRNGDSRGAQEVKMSAAINVPGADYTFVYVLDPMASIQHQMLYEMLTAADGRVSSHMTYPESDFGGVLPDYHGNMVMSVSGFTDMGRKMAACPQVIVVRSNGTNTEVFVDGTSIGTAPAGSGTATQLYIGAGKDMSPITNYIAAARWGAAIVINKRINDTDVAAITSALMNRFDIPTVYDAIVVDIGTSRIRGGTASTGCRNKAFYERAHYGSKRIKFYNLGLDGVPLSTHYSSRANHAAEVYSSGIPVIYIIEDAINDLGGLGASTDPVAIYTTMTSFSNFLKALGSNAKTVLGTTLPQTSSAYGRTAAAIETDRSSLNTMVTGNAAGANAVSDPASNVAVGSYPAGPNDTTLYPDSLHLSSLGYYQARTYNPAAVLSLLP